MKLLVIQQCYRVIESMKQKKLPVNVSFIIYRNVKKLIPIIQDIENNRKELLQKYMKKDDDGNPIIIDNKYDLTDLNAFNKQMNELLNTDISIDFDKISKFDIQRCDEDKFDSLTLEEIAVLQDFMIKEDSEN